MGNNSYEAIWASSFCDALTRDRDVEDTASVMVKFESAAQGLLECYVSVPEDDLTLILLDMGDSRFVHINTGWVGGVGRGGPPGIVGMEGTIAESEGMIHLYRNDSEEWTDYPVVGKPWSIPSGLIHLAKCIVNGEQPKITIEHTRHVVEIMEKTYVAARTGQAQEITTTF